ncbi:hypothetical protein PYCCODRAFT_915764 [Trametes coccinea BRFM310]|uniref:Uncharacterized protein n=1 Tax=Trametes coccinea (strain BRFM310) TaxID=1353009 RepID=A0A1Y2IEN3_TRAC3|nr:hypothetical protein PYCCODRAFT_915764 [Trametes coccinea BRFM310]
MDKSIAAAPSRLTCPTRAACREVTAVAAEKRPSYASYPLHPMTPPELPCIEGTYSPSVHSSTHQHADDDAALPERTFVHRCKPFLASQRSTLNARGRQLQHRDGPVEVV